MRWTSRLSAVLQLPQFGAASRADLCEEFKNVSQHHSRSQHRSLMAKRNMLPLTICLRWRDGDAISFYSGVSKVTIIVSVSANNEFTPQYSNIAIDISTIRYHVQHSYV